MASSKENKVYETLKSKTNSLRKRMGSVRGWNRKIRQKKKSS